MNEQDNTAIDLRKAIKQSFNKLYVKEFTTGWQEARMIRGIEIDLLDLSAIQQHTEAAVREALDERNDETDDTLDDIEGCAAGRYYPSVNNADRLKQIVEAVAELRKEITK